MFHVEFQSVCLRETGPVEEHIESAPIIENFPFETYKKFADQ
jgi:hypothetical protein